MTSTRNADDDDAHNQTAVDELRQHLHTVRSGPLTDTAGDLEDLLAACWASFSGSREHGMEPDKLLGRMENVTWNPPELSFVIERHGGTVAGSSRGELHTWVVNLDLLTAKVAARSYRQLYAREPPLKVEPLADETASLILQRAEHPWLKWYSDEKVRVQVGEIISGVGAQQTVTGRRKRFRKALEAKLAEHGWQLEHPTSRYTYRRAI